MAIANEWFDLDMAMMSDDALIVLAKECEYGPARNELILRYASQRDRLIGWLAKTTSFRPADIEDARQNAVFWTLEAIEKYDTEQIALDQGCSFYSFLNRVLICRFKDYTKHLHRRERHYVRSNGSPPEDQSTNGRGGRPCDPATLAESRESLARLYASLAQLDGESNRIWELLVEGNSLREISAELGISYDAIKRRRRKLIQHLKSKLTPQRG
jgi:RNA polymerase sigma factor (sigma-70 family)